MENNLFGEGRSELIPACGIYSSKPNFARTGPLTVHAIGYGGEDLGVGSLIGIIHRQKGNARVISFQDPDSPEGVSELLSTECAYSRLTDKELEKIATKKDSKRPMTPTQYLVSILNIDNEIIE